MSDKTYSIGEVARRTGISAYTLRYYDKESLLGFVKRDPYGNRLFCEEDFEPLYTITCLKRAGMPIKKIREFMKLYLQGDETISQRKQMYEEQLVEIRNQIKELQEMEEIVEYKCWYFAEAEKAGDTYFYRNLPADEVPERIHEFMRKVQAFKDGD